MIPGEQVETCLGYVHSKFHNTVPRCKDVAIEERGAGDAAGCATSRDVTTRDVTREREIPGNETW